MKAALFIWVLIVICGVALAIFAADGVAKVIGILLAVVGLFGVVRAGRRQNT